MHGLAVDHQQDYPDSASWVDCHLQNVHPQIKENLVAPKTTSTDAQTAVALVELEETIDMHIHHNYCWVLLGMQLELHHIQ